MEENRKSFEQFIEEEMRKTPEQLEEEILSDPEYPKMTPTPEMYEKLMARIAVYEAEKTGMEEVHEKDSKELLDQLSEDDREALLLGREIRARRQSAEERSGIAENVHRVSSVNGSEEKQTVVHFKRRKKKKKKAYLLVAAAMLVACGFGVTAFGGPEKIINSMTGTLGGREQAYFDVGDNQNSIISGDTEEETAYQNIKDKLGFDAVRPVYLPKGYKFQEMRMNEEIQNVSIIYSSGATNLIYTIQGNYSDNKFGLDIEDKKIEEYYLTVDDLEILIKSYVVLDSEQKEYLAEFIWKGSKYYLTGILEKEEFDEVIKNLHFM